ncbi:MAG: Hsp20/alpha crystallin family protein [Candidatus Bathyarchaeota archaeon]|jgi:HSP20 family protein
MQEKRRKRSISDMIRDYIEDIQDLAEELLEPIFAERPSWDARSCCLEPLCSVSVTPDEVIVTSDLPNIDPDAIEVTPINADTLEIKAKMKRKIRFDELGITHRKGEFQFFRCQIDMPVPVNMDQIKAEFKGGILEIHLPRKKGHREKDL